MKLILALCALVVLCFAASLFAGSGQVSAIDAAWAYLGQGDPLVIMVMQELRLPRAILGGLVGAALGLSGAAMQGLMRNPLAEPGVMGTSTTAALGAVLALQTGLAAVTPFAVPVAALMGAALSVGLLLLLAGPATQTATLILAGVAVSAAAGALVSLTLNLSPNPFAASEIMLWMMGSLVDRSFSHVWIALPFMALGALILWRTGRGLDALSFGEETALSLGIDPKKLRWQVILGTASLCGAAVAAVGAVGFVGLVVPHMLRRATGGLPSRLMLPSALGGAALVLAADTLVRVLLPGRDLQLGVVTALIGTPVFIQLVWRQRGESQ